MIDINITDMNPKSIAQTLKTTSGLPFEALLPIEMMEQALINVDYRDGIYTPSTTVWCLLSQALDEDQSLQASVLRLVARKAAANEEIPSANTSAYSQARSRLPVEVLETLSEQVAEDTTKEILVKWKWRGLNPKLVDGSTLSMPDTLENQKKYPQPKTQKKGVGFPLARFVVIICFITGTVLKFAMDSYAGKETGEHALLRQIIEEFKPGDIALGDAYYPSYFLVCDLMKSKAEFVFPAHGSRESDFRTGKRLGKKDHIVSWVKPSKPEWMDQETYDNYAKIVKIREVEIVSEKSGFKTKKRTLVTSFLDPKKVTKKDLSNLYAFRLRIPI